MSKILVVEDSVKLTKLMASALSGMGHETEVINTLKGAFELAKKVKPDIVMLDVMLQDGAGYEVARAIRQDPELYPTPILYVSTLSGEPEIRHALEQGGDAYLTKPFTVPELTSKLASLGALQKSLDSKDSVTGLPGVDALRREIDHRLVKEEHFALAYVHIDGEQAHRGASGKTGEELTLKRTAALLTRLVRTSGFYESYVSYMGSGYFGVLLELEDAERFSKCLVETFDQTVRQMAPETADEKRRIGASNGARIEDRPGLRLRGCVVHSSSNRFRGASNVFDALRCMYESVKGSGHSVVVVEGH